MTEDPLLLREIREVSARISRKNGAAVRSLLCAKPTTPASAALSPFAMVYLMPHDWPDHLDVGAVRFARPTANFDDVVAFYRDAVGLPVLAQWRDHAGYDGVVFGLPGTPVHMEITQYGRPPKIPEPHPENQLVLYLRGPDAVTNAVQQLSAHGHLPVDAANPYWPEHGAVLFKDPDGWIVVLAPWVFGEQDPPNNPSRAWR